MKEGCPLRVLDGVKLIRISPDTVYNTTETLIPWAGETPDDHAAIVCDG